MAQATAFRQTFERWERHGSFYQMAGIIPEGTSGKWSIRHRVKTEISARELIRPDEFVPPGTYCDLTVAGGGGPWMSDTPMERRTNLAAISHARGEVLIGGLGIGLIVLPILLRADVRRVTVVEKHPNVIALVQPWLEQARVDLGAPAALSVIEGDVYAWTPGKWDRFDAIYFDIWKDICTDALDDMKVLSARFRKYRAKGGWLGAWQKDRLIDERRRERRMGVY